MIWFFDNFCNTPHPMATPSDEDAYFIRRRSHPMRCISLSFAKIDIEPFILLSINFILGLKKLKITQNEELFI